MTQVQTGCSILAGSEPPKAGRRLRFESSLQDCRRITCTASATDSGALTTLSHEVPTYTYLKPKIVACSFVHVTRHGEDGCSRCHAEQHGTA